jgi:tetratricopeptide (TPR) repeat protein
MHGEITKRILEKEAQLRQQLEDPQELLGLGDLYRQLTLHHPAVRCYEQAHQSRTEMVPQPDRGHPEAAWVSIPAFDPLEQSKIQFSSTKTQDWMKSRLTQPAGATALLCTHCLSVTTSPDSFHPDGVDLLCPVCLKLRREQSLERGALVSLILIFSGIAIGILLANQILIYASLNILLFFLLLYPLLFFHELAHTISALLLGGKVYRLQVGSGKLGFKRMIGSVGFDIHWIPSAGSTSFAFSSPSALRLRYTITLLAGPLLNLILLSLVLFDFQGNRILSGLALLEVFLLANLFILLGSLLPASDRPSTDSIQLLRVLFDTDSDQKLSPSYFLQETRQTLEQGRLEKALQLCKAGIDRSPDTRPLNVLYGKLLLELECPKEALNHWEALANQTIPSPEPNASIQSGMAAAYLKLQDPRAYDLALHAYRIAPWLPTAQQTWGQALFAAGEYPAAAYHLLAAAQHHPSTRDQAICLADAALTFLCMGDRERAEALLLRARRLDPKPRAISSATQQIFP